jgi:hypothetical protein
MKLDCPDVGVLRELMLKGVYCTFLTYVLGIAFVCLILSTDGGISIDDLAFLPVLGVFGVPIFLPTSILGGVFTGVLCVRRRFPWAWLFVLAVVCGVAGSILIQWIRPFDVYHESDGSLPGWRPIHLFSTLTLRGILVAIPTIFGSAVLARKVLYTQSRRGLP